MPPLARFAVTLPLTLTRLWRLPLPCDRFHIHTLARFYIDRLEGRLACMEPLALAPML